MAAGGTPTGTNASLTPPTARPPARVSGAPPDGSAARRGVGVAAERVLQQARVFDGGDVALDAFEVDQEPVAGSQGVGRGAHHQSVDVRDERLDRVWVDRGL